MPIHGGKRRWVLLSGTENDPHVVIAAWQYTLPPPVILTAEGFHHFRMLAGYIHRLAGILRDVVKLEFGCGAVGDRIHHAPTLCKHRSVFPFVETLLALRIYKQSAVLPFRVRAVQLCAPGYAIHELASIFELAQVRQGGQDIDVSSQCRDVAASLQPSGWPGNKQRYAMTTLVGRPFLASHRCVEHLVAVRGAVVRGKDQDRVVPQTPVVQEPEHFAQVAVDIRNHAVEPRLIEPGNIAVRGGIFLRRPFRLVCGSRRKVAEKWLFFSGSPHP